MGLLVFHGFTTSLTDQLNLVGSWAPWSTSSGFIRPFSHPFKFWFRSHDQHETSQWIIFGPQPIRGGRSSAFDFVTWPLYLRLLDCTDSERFEIERAEWVFFPVDSIQFNPTQLRSLVIFMLSGVVIQGLWFIGRVILVHGENWRRLVIGLYFWGYEVSNPSDLLGLISQSWDDKRTRP